MKTLVLDKQYQPIRFIKLRKLIVFIVKDKVDVLSVWPIKYNYFNQGYPAIVRLKEHVRKKPRIPRFNRRSLFIRDNFTCQYSGKKLPASKLTIDHVIPKSKGGNTSWDNCVTAALDVNLEKGDRLPEDADLVLLSKPKPPAQQIVLEFENLNNKHPEWKDYFNVVEN